MSLNSNPSSSICLTRVDARHQCSVLWVLVLLSVASSSMAFLSGCGSSVATKAGAISVTYPSGVTADQFPVLSTVAVSMAPLNEKVNAGVGLDTDVRREPSGSAGVRRDLGRVWHVATRSYGKRCPCDLHSSRADSRGNHGDDHRGG